MVSTRAKLALAVAISVVLVISILFTFYFQGLTVEDTSDEEPSDSDESADDGSSDSGDLGDESEGADEINDEDDSDNSEETSEDGEMLTGEIPDESEEKSEGGDAVPDSETEEEASFSEENQTTIPKDNGTEEINASLPLNDTLDFNLTNETLLINETFELNETILNETILNETILNETILNETIINITDANITESFIQYDAVIGKPVKWKKTLSSDAVLDGITTEIHKEADNIIVTVVDADDKETARDETTESNETTHEEVDPEKVTVPEIGDMSVAALAISGSTVYNTKYSWYVRLFNWLKKTYYSFSITGFASIFDDESINETIDLKIEESFKGIEIEYETPGPGIIEDKSSVNAYRITVYSDIHYVNITAFTSIPSGSFAHVYHIVNDTKELVDNSLVISENGSRVEWIVPHLSEQVYEVEIIEITMASHLDSNRTFIENIYDAVKARDDVWKDIPANDYVRIIFEKELDSSRDITIYARSNSSGGVEVYEENSSVKLAEFGTISEDKKYRILLTNLTGLQNTFDLKVTNYSVEFDYIVDPNTVPTHSDPKLNATDYPVNSTNANITCYNQSTADIDGDSVVNVYNWEIDGTPMMGLYAPFEEGAYDRSGNGNIITVTGATLSASGLIGKAYDFERDSGNNYLSVADSPSISPTSELTLCVWIKHENLVNNYQAIFNKWQNYAPASKSYMLWSRDANSIFRFGIVHDAAATKMTSVDSTTAPSEGVWIFLCGVYNGTASAIYYDGDYEASTACTHGGDCANINDAAAPLLIGQGTSSAGAQYHVYLFDGLIDDARVYPIALSSTQIKQLYLDTKDGYSIEQTIVSDETTENDVWTCNISPHDATDYGLSKETSITIRGIDSTKPLWKDNTTNCTSANIRTGVTCNFNITLTDETGVGIKRFSHNTSTGAIANDTDAAWVNNTKISEEKTIGAATGEVIYWGWYFNDSSDNWNWTNYWELTVLDGTNPTWTTVDNNATSSTEKGDAVMWNASIADETALDTYWLETNDTGAWVNQTGSTIAGNPAGATVNDNYTITAAASSTVCGRMWFNDTYGNENVTDSSCFDVAAAPVSPLPPGGGGGGGGGGAPTKEVAKTKEEVIISERAITPIKKAVSETAKKIAKVTVPVTKKYWPVMVAITLLITGMGFWVKKRSNM